MDNLGTTRRRPSVIADNTPQAPTANDLDHLWGQITAAQIMIHLCLESMHRPIGKKRVCICLWHVLSERLRFVFSARVRDRLTFSVRVKRLFFQRMIRRLSYSIPRHGYATFPPPKKIPAQEARPQYNFENVCGYKRMRMSNEWTRTCLYLVRFSWFVGRSWQGRC